MKRMSQTKCKNISNETYDVTNRKLYVPKTIFITEHFIHVSDQLFVIRIASLKTNNVCTHV